MLWISLKDIIVSTFSLTYDYTLITCHITW